MKTYQIISYLLLLTSYSGAQVRLPGKCPPTRILKNFNWKLYLGQWYEQERYFTFYQNVGRCWTGKYFKKNKGKGMSIKLTFQDYLLKRRQEIFIDVFAKRPYEAPNRLTYTIPGIPFFEDNYEVISTDYDNWTIEYSCRNSRNVHTRFAWILTRALKPSYEVIATAKAEMIRLGIDVNYLRKSDQQCHKN